MTSKNERSAGDQAGWVSSGAAGSAVCTCSCQIGPAAMSFARQPRNAPLLVCAATNSPQPGASTSTGEPTKPLSGNIAQIRLARREDGEVRRELDEVLAVAGLLVEPGARVRTALERVRGADVERMRRRAVGGTAPAEDAAATAQRARDREPARDGLAREDDADQLPLHRRHVAERPGRHVDGAVDEAQGAPVELLRVVAVEDDGPAGSLAAGCDSQCVEPPERIDDVERPRRPVDDGCSRHSPTVGDLRARVDLLAEVDPPAHVAVRSQPVHVTGCGTDDHGLARGGCGRDDERLRRHHPRQRREPRLAQVADRACLVDPCGAAAEGQPSDERRRRVTPCGPREEHDPDRKERSPHAARVVGSAT